MGAIYLRGGIPVHVNGSTANNTAEKWGKLGPQPANHLYFRNTGANTIVLSFTEADAGTGISVAAGASVDVPAECDYFYTKSAAGVSSFQAIAFLRRG